ncbi:hypothetical protein [uncultured Bacteroides sp.]|uniref:hypothetical protein n=1 Tax=uncultured Bacteroides sp. TaxID=162156 RepID=UPI002AAB2D37|nr:hypothetical protein [uncultured Bacteroides sp.]
MSNKDIIEKQSVACSNVCRQIVFALGAISWGIIYSNTDKKATFIILPSISIILIIIYFCVDISQYSYSAIQTRKIEKSYRTHYRDENNKEKQEKIERNYFITNEKIEKIVFKLFITKIAILLIITILLIAYFVSEMNL